MIGCVSYLLNYVSFFRESSPGWVYGPGTKSRREASHTVMIDSMDLVPKHVSQPARSWGFVAPHSRQGDGFHSQYRKPGLRIKYWEHMGGGTIFSTRATGLDLFFGGHSIGVTLTAGNHE